jgi:hypothetical protein
MPELLYKYVPIERLDIISNGLIRFTQPGDFNDPFELHPSFDLLSRADIATLNAAPDDFARADLFNKMISAIMPGLARMTQDLEGKQGMFLIDNNRLARETFDAHFGILSLTEAPDNLLMWAHHANNHNGLVLQFNEQHSFFAPMSFEGQTLELTRMQYTVDRPVLSSTSLYSTIIYYRKSPDWSYEREWRLIKPLTSATKVLPSNLRPIHLFSFPPDTLTGIIVGLRVSDEVRDEISVICARPEFKHVRIHHTHLSRDQYKLEIHPALDGTPPRGAVLEAR